MDVAFSEPAGSFFYASGRKQVSAHKIFWRLRSCRRALVFSACNFHGEGAFLFSSMQYALECQPP